MCVCVCVCVCAGLPTPPPPPPPTDLSVASRPSVSSKLTYVNNHTKQKKYVDTHDQKLFCAHPNFMKITSTKTHLSDCASSSQRQTSANMSFVFSVVIVWTALRRDFSGSSHTSDLKIGTPVATLPSAWHYRVS